MEALKDLNNARQTKRKHSKSLEDLLSEISKLVKLPIRDSDPRHTLFSYPAKFQATVPQFIVENFSANGDSILDPFGGGGTTAACSMSVGRNFVHYDLSPFSCMVAKAKTANVAKSQVDYALALLKNSILKASKPILTSEEEILLGSEVSKAINHCWYVAEKIRPISEDLSAVISVILAKLVKVCGRRDATTRREKPAAEHIKYLSKQIEGYCDHLIQSSVLANARAKKISCASNHALPHYPSSF